jgi:hypothetical protein
MATKTIPQILVDLEKVEQFVVQVRQTGTVVAIERDITLGRLQSIYEQIQQLQNQSPALTDVLELEEEIVTFVPTPEPSKPVAKPTPPTRKPEEESIQKILHEQAPAPKAAPEKEKAAPVLPVTKAPEHPTTLETFAEKFQHTAFLNEALSQYADTNNLSKKFQNQPLKDIFSAIGLNDKFLFIKELFNNDASLYESTIEKINSAAGFDEAVRYLDENFTWDFSKSQAQKLLDLVHRRYMPN